MSHRIDDNLAEQVRLREARCQLAQVCQGGGELNSVRLWAAQDKQLQNDDETGCNSYLGISHKPPKFHTPHSTQLGFHLRGPVKDGESGLGPVRIWPGALCVSRSIGDVEAGPHVVPCPHIKQV